MAPTLTYSGRSALAWTPIVAATVVIGARIFVRVRRRALGVDDHLILLSLVLAFVSAGLAQTLFIIRTPTTPQQIGQFGAVNGLASATATLSICLGKTSVGFLLLRLVYPMSHWRRWFIVLTTVGLAILTFFAMVANLIPSCATRNALLAPGGCLEEPVYFGFLQAWNFYGVFIDIAYSTLPISIIWRLRMGGDKKTAIVVLAGLGWTAAIFTLLRAIAAYGIWSASTAGYITSLATAMEQGLIMVCGSLITLTPLFQFWWHGKPLRPSGNRDSPTLIGGPRSTTIQHKRSDTVSTVESG